SLHIIFCHPSLHEMQWKDLRARQTIPSKKCPGSKNVLLLRKEVFFPNRSVDDPVKDKFYLTRPNNPAGLHMNKVCLLQNQPVRLLHSVPGGRTSLYPVNRIVLSIA